ncbi:MAG: hypothetical protein ACI35O_08125 [Bacillaceae bacterium]
MKKVLKVTVLALALALMVSPVAGMVENNAPSKAALNPGGGR